MTFRRLGLVLHALAEGQKRRCGNLFNRRFRVEARLVAPPREADDNPVIRLIGIDLVVRDALGHHAQLDNRLGRLKLLRRRINAVRRAEGRLHAAANVDAPSYIADALNPRILRIAVLRINAEDRRIAEHEDQCRDDKKHRFLYSLHLNYVPPVDKAARLHPLCIPKAVPAYKAGWQEPPCYYVLWITLPNPARRGARGWRAKRASFRNRSR